MKLDKKYFVGMWLMGEETAKFAVASGLASSEREFLDAGFILEDVLHREAWDNDSFKMLSGDSRPFNDREESVTSAQTLLLSESPRSLNSMRSSYYSGT